jgi:hypothetical protein
MLPSTGLKVNNRPFEAQLAIFMSFISVKNELQLKNVYYLRAAARFCMLLVRPERRST